MTSEYVSAQMERDRVVHAYVRTCARTHHLADQGPRWVERTCSSSGGNFCDPRVSRRESRSGTERGTRRGRVWQRQRCRLDDPRLRRRRRSRALRGRGLRSRPAARWQAGSRAGAGRQWSPVGSGVRRRPCRVPDDLRRGQREPELYAAGGLFFANSAAGAQSNVRGAQWSRSRLGCRSELGTSGDGARARSVYDDGSGPALYAGGYVQQRRRCSREQRRAVELGTAWSALGSGITGNGSSVQRARRP